MFRSVLLLILMLLVSGFALQTAPSGNDLARVPVLTKQALAANPACTHHDTHRKMPKLQRGCDTAQACADCKTCHVCPLSVLAVAAVTATSAGPFIYTRPPHAAASWLSAEHAPDFRPPIL